MGRKAPDPWILTHGWLSRQNGYVPSPFRAGVGFLFVGALSMNRYACIQVLASVMAFCLFLPVASFGDPQDPEALALEKTLTELKSPEAVTKFMHEKFRIVEDSALFGKDDYWQSPEEFLSRRAGDCEDFALFAQSALTRIGFESYVISLYAPAGYAHTVTLFKQDGVYNIINDGRLYRYGTLTPEEALTRVRPDWTWASRAERKNSRGWSLLQIKNPSPARSFQSVNSFADFSS